MVKSRLPSNDKIINDKMTKTGVDGLTDYRERIDLIDRGIIDLLTKRMKVVGEIGKCKRERGIPPLDEKRWKEVLESKMKRARKLGLDDNFVKEIYELIHRYALSLEGGS